MKMETLRENTLRRASELISTNLPKFELHAHINGSIPLELLKKFAQQDAAKYSQNNNNQQENNNNKKGGEEKEELLKKAAAEKLVNEIELCMTPLPSEATAKTRMEHAFKVFDVIYKVMTTRERLYEATRAATKFFIDEGCIYFELRTTPKTLPDGTSDEQYVSCVLDAMEQEIKEHNQKKEQKQECQCNLLLSINRRGKPEAASRVIDLAILFREKEEEKNKKRLVSVVGIDFCGDCYANTFIEFLPALEKARKAGLPSTLHMGEKQDDEEVQQMLDFSPERVGHCCFINSKAHETLRLRQIPLEICITSNILTGGLSKPSQHHVVSYMVDGGRHPVCINTDDFSVFSTTLKKELELFAEICFDLFASSTSASKGEGEGEESNIEKDALRFVFSELFRVQYCAARSSFVSHSERAKLLQILDSVHEKCWAAEGFK